MTRRARKSSLFRGVKTLLSRLFCKRSIIVVSEHKTGHLPVNVGIQLLSLAAIFGAIAWVSYSTGSYMAAQSILAEKDRKIAQGTLENHKIEGEFALLKRDLLKVLDQKEKGLSEYAEFVIEQYKQGGESEAIPTPEIAAGTMDHNIIFERIGFLEKQVEHIRQNHLEMVDAIREATDSKIDELEDVLATTGLSQKELLRAAEKELRDGDNPRGGPFNPAYDDNPMIQQDADIFEDMSHMMLLHDVIDELPLAAPMKEYRLTSGYGTRIDPFRKRPAHHAGLDFVSKTNQKIYAPADGKVEFAGRKGAYGLLVTLDHGLKITTRYGHLSKILVKEDQTVKKGQVIGIQGNTGRSTGAHLHYEVRYKNKTLNPKNFLKAGKHVREKQDG